MNYLSTLRRKLTAFFKSFTTNELILYGVLLILFLVNAKYVAYTDEFVNLLGAQAITHGHFPYKDFFDNHLPLPWYLGAILLNVSFNSFVIFRILWALFTFGGFFILGLWIRKHYRDFYNYYLFFFFFYPILAVYFWFHLYLGDSLATYFFSLTFWILIVQTLTKKTNENGLKAAALLTFCLVFSSLAFLYLVAILYLWQIYLWGFSVKKILRFSPWIFVPYLIYLIGLIISGSLRDFYFANFTYNTTLYIGIPNYIRGAHFNPLKFAQTLIFNFYTGYFPLLTKIKYLDLYLPIGELAALGTFSLLVYLFFTNRFIFLLFFFVLSFSAPRSTFKTFNETDYQVSLFLILGVISAIVSIYVLQRLKRENTLMHDLGRVVQLLLVVFFIFSTFFLFKNTYDKYFKRYTQQFPSIRNTGDIAQFIDQVVDNGEYFWVGPYEPNEAFFVKKGQLPGKYPTLLPQFRENDYMKATFIEQFDRNRPKIIVFKHDASIFGTPALEFGKFFLDWMKGKYTSIEHIDKIKVLKSPTNMNLGTDLYILNSDREALLLKLKQNGYIEY